MGETDCSILLVLGVGFQGTRAGMDCWISGCLWLSGIPSCITSVFFAEFLWAEVQRQGRDRQGAQPFFFSSFPLGSALLPRHELLLSTQEGCSGFRQAEHLKL